MKLWEKGYQLNKEIEKFTAGEDYLTDRKLVKYDCIASIAHAKMLHKTGLLAKSEVDRIIRVLNQIIKLSEKGKFVIRQEDEDCHTAIENYLTKRLGKTGKKIHAARSRNDQVLTALRLYYKDEIKTVETRMHEFEKSLASFKEKYGSVEMPGYTHMRKAMPSSVALWAECFTESMHDNRMLLNDIAKLTDQSPLGTGAGYGLPMDVDRNLTARLLGFAKVQNNPIYAQNSRGKFEASVLHALSQIMLDLNRIASDMVLFSMPEFGYFELPREICTGSSIMPHKRNPDVLELVRAKYHQLLAREFEVKSIIGNLVSGYNRDLQLTKKPVFEGFEITKNCLGIMKLVVEKLQVNEENCSKAMTAELYAVKKTYELSGKGMPFRDAYKAVSKEFE